MNVVCISLYTRLRICTSIYVYMDAYMHCAIHACIYAQNNKLQVKGLRLMNNKHKQLSILSIGQLFYFGEGKNKEYLLYAYLYYYEEYLLLITLSQIH